MDDLKLGDGQLNDVLRELEETMEKANLLALDLALRGIEEGAGQEGRALDLDGISRFVECAARTTEGMERLVRQVKAA